MIGIFDSGVGGLSVLREIKKSLPEYDYVYFGDNKRAPYGGKDFDTLYRYTCEALDFLFSQNCKIVIVACNTISARVLRKIQQEYLINKYPDKKVLGIVIPIVEGLNNIITQEKNKVGVLATEETINSQVYNNEVKRLGIQCKLLTYAAPRLAQIVEEDKNKVSSKILNNYLLCFKNNIDYLILGCTHYDFVKKDIEKILGNKIKVINTSEEISFRLKKYLDKHNNLEKNLNKNSEIFYFTTGDTNKFKKFVVNNLNFKNYEIQKINIPYK